MEIHNGNVLATLPGLLDMVESIDHVNTHCLEKTVPQTVSLKPGCNIILIYNINDQLKKWLPGKAMLEKIRLTTMYCLYTCLYTCEGRHHTNNL